MKGTVPLKIGKSKRLSFPHSSHCGIYHNCWNYDK